jgi:xanthine/CO dehydrogenase XdhC/CoxF family maturation factor
MADLDRILPLWRELETAGADYVLATVIEVQGSSYRKPGACMLLAPDGRRAGTVSGGCLEAQVATRAWWLTASGPVIQRYSTAEEDGELPYGSGCGGVVFLLLERRPTAGPLLSALEQAHNRRTPLAVATILESPQIGCRAFAGLAHHGSKNFDPVLNSLQELAEQSLASRTSTEQHIEIEGAECRAWVDYRSARPGLWIFGAGDDAQPLLHLSKELGWFVTVSDGRSHLATRVRFPLADELHVLNIQVLLGNQKAAPVASIANLQPHDAAVLMTHSFEQDARVLASLLTLDVPLAYIGVLGPQRRTRELLVEVARLLNLIASTTSAIDARVELWLTRLHAPMGIDLGAESPESIALSILAEIQQSLTASTALPLRQVRATTLAPSS